MTVEEAVKVIDLSKKCTEASMFYYCMERECHDCEYFVQPGDTADALKTIDKALGKATAKEPTNKEALTVAFYVGLCAECGSAINSNMDYCPNCGQRIDWSEE